MSTKKAPKATVQVKDLNARKEIKGGRRSPTGRKPNYKPL